MVAPYSGWSEINSFFDHDSPDYSRDGEIILSNGLTASSSDGISSDFFPAYWSPALRQYINYDGHNGYDFGISYQPVLAAGDGTVRFAGWNDSDPSVGYGQMVLIDHHNGYVTLYGHLSKLEVKIGDKVQAGEEIGISGSTGNSTGPHLHFSVFHNCQVTDPYGWTGHGADPLQGFNGEQSAYLWLPGHDPLVLNPPPKWSAFPLGLKVPLPRRDIPLGIRRVPPVDRLLLLKLPLPRPGRAVGSAVALARTESLVTQEAEEVAPYLADLQAQGLVETYAVIPAAAAVWLRGTATAAQLEGLPGVASLGGVQPRDLIAAQAGLSHSILIQIGGQQAPSLWPVAFRSSLQAWRPITTVPNNSALVTGFAQPGQHVVVSLLRGSSLAGATEALGDSETGGFVAMIHDRSGNPVLTRTGDSVEVRIGNRTERVAVMSCSLKARPRRISGQAPPGATVAVSVMDTSESVVWKTVTTASQLGRFGTNLPFPLPAGSLAVASVVDAAGNQESATGFVPGVQIEENSPTVHGWTVGASPRFWVVRHGRTMIDRRVHPAPDGTFQIELQTGKQPMALVPGDVVSIGSRWHHHVFTVPGLRIRLPLFSSRVTVAGPPRAVAHITAFGNDGHTWDRKLRFGASGRAQVSWPAGAIGTGDAATLDFVTAAGDTVVAGDQVRGFIVREGDSLIRGRTRPGTTLSIHALTPKGVPLGGAVVASDAETGTFSTRLHDAAGHPVAVNGAVRLVVRDTASTITLSAPALTLQMGQKQAIAWTVPRASVLLTTVDRVQGEQIHRLKADASGRVVTGVVPADGPQRINVSLTVQDGLTVERSVVRDGSRHRSATIRAAPRKPAHTR